MDTSHKVKVSPKVKVTQGQPPAPGRAPGLAQHPLCPCSHTALLTHCSAHSKAQGQGWEPVVDPGCWQLLAGTPIVQGLAVCPLCLGKQCQACLLP